MARQLRLHLDKFSIFPQHQSGSRKKYGCERALLHITDEVFTALDKNYMLLLVLLNFTKAFDSVNHILLFAILQYIGIGPYALKLFESYFTNRMQKVVLSSAQFSLGLVSCGVPQGSVLRPILFTIYT